MKQTVYFVQAGSRGPIKIGSADDVEHRVRSLCTACPSPLRILATIMPDDVHNETSLHRRFDRHRLEGEWFKPDPDPPSRIRRRREIARNLAKQRREAERLAARHYRELDSVSALERMPVQAMESVREALRQSEKPHGAISAETGIHVVNLSQFKAGTRDIIDVRKLNALAKSLGLTIEAKRKRGAK